MNTTPIRSIVANLAAVTVWMLGMQAQAQPAGWYPLGQAHSVGAAEEGVVLQVTTQQTPANLQSRIGATAIGGVLGALVGDGLGQDYQSKATLRTLGAIAGGLAAERAADAVASTEAQEVVIGIFNPSTKAIARVVSILQPAPFESLLAHDRVLVVTTNGAARVVKVTYDLSKFEK